MEVRAELNFTRTAPRKMRLSADMLRGKKASEALDILEFSKRWAAKPLLKLLNSALANAAHNFNLQKDNLYIKTIKVNQGPMLKRWTPKAFGRASAVQKKTSHIIIILDELKQEQSLSKAKAVAGKDKNPKSQIPNSKQITNSKSKITKTRKVKKE